MLGFKKQTREEKAAKKIAGYDKVKYFKTVWQDGYELWSKPICIEDKTLHMSRMVDIFFGNDKDQLIRDTHDVNKCLDFSDNFYVIRNL